MIFGRILKYEFTISTFAILEIRDRGDKRVKVDKEDQIDKMEGSKTTGLEIKWVKQHIVNCSVHLFGKAFV